MPKRLEDGSAGAPDRARSLGARSERWPIAGAFSISRGARTHAEVVVVELRCEGRTGRGEATPYARYGESPESVLGAIEAMREPLERGLSRPDLQRLMPAGAARNAVDCALWDLEAKLSGRRAWEAAGSGAPRPVETLYTISLDEPAAMARAAAAAGRRLLKLKIAAEGAVERVAAVRQAAPQARLVVDANEALSMEELTAMAPRLGALGVELIEQPLPAGHDQALEGYGGPVPLCADESLHTRADLEVCARRYACVNIKLDKAGGLTEALALAREAKARGLDIMAGCMVATSLSMAPAMLLAQEASYVDLDGALLLAKDREPGLAAQGSILDPPTPQLWG